MSNHKTQDKKLEELLMNVYHQGSMARRGKTINPDMFSKEAKAVRQAVIEEVLEVLPKDSHSARFFKQKVANLPKNTATTNANLSSVAMGYNLATNEARTAIKNLAKGEKE